MFGNVVSHYRLISLSALAQLFLLSTALPSFAQQTVEVMKEQEKIEQQVDRETAKIAQIKEKEAAELAKIKAKEAAEAAKIKEKEAEEAAKAKERAAHHGPPKPTPPAPAPPPVSKSGPNINGVPMFPGSIFSTDISDCPVDPNSANWLTHLGSAGASQAFLFYVFGPCGQGKTVMGTLANGIQGDPINIVGPDQAEVPFEATVYPSECDKGPVPMPPNFAVEGSVCPGGPANVFGGDIHCSLLQTGTTGRPNLFEFYNWNGTTGPVSLKNANGSMGGFMASWDTRSNNMRPAGWTSTCAGGFPLAPVLIRYEEVAAGAINHAMYCSINWVTDNACVWPASHTISSGPNDPTNYCPMGAWLRLKASFDISGFNPACQAVLKAAQKYGIIVGDVNGGGETTYLAGVPSQNWLNAGDSTPPGSLYDLWTVKMADFDFIDVSSKMVSPTSYAAKIGTNSIGGSSSGDSSAGGGTSGIQIESHHNSAPRKN